MSTWNYIVIILSLLLLAYMCWNEFRRASRSRLVARLAASVVAVVSFACLVLPVSRTLTTKNENGKTAILLTEGFEKDSIDYFLKVHKNIAVYSLNNNLVNTAKNYGTKFLSLPELAILQRSIAELNVFGFGLETDELATLHSVDVNFHPSKISAGVAFVNWQHKIKTGEHLKVQGHFSNTSASQVKLIFSGYDVNLDTAVIPANSSSNFELMAFPKQLGKAVYTLTAISGKDTLEKDPVPFEVEDADHLKVLILAASPDFENKFLKSWLSQDEYALVSRTTISKDKYEKTFLNTPQVSFNTINASFLNEFDLVIADMSELAAIGRRELAAIESQVMQRGMGLIIKGDSAAAKSSFYSRPFPVVQNSDNKQKDLSVYIPASNTYATVAGSEHPAYIRPLPGTKSLIEDKQSNVIVSSTIYGSGRLIYTTLSNTFTWMLSGNNKDYQSYWSYLLQEATAKTNVDKAWSISPAYPVVNKPVQVHYTSDDVEIPRLQVGKDFVHLIQNPDLPFQWQGTYWPQKEGWQPVLQDNKNTFWWYAYNSRDWKTILASQKIKETFDGIKRNEQDSSLVPGQNTSARVPVNKIYFVIAFLSCLGFLWLEKKV